jgi:pimeloyl-ACP methyl ester carboxylesterase
MTLRQTPTALAAALLALLSAGPALADEMVKVEVGQIQGARFAIAVPAVAWNKRVLLLAHGYRPESAPQIADLNTRRASIRAALDGGWIVATTSYRRNGLVIGDAIADLDALRAYIAAAYGDPERVVIEGDSSGGLIATIIAERDKGLYDGAVAFDATLYIKETNSQVGLTLQPRIPLLFVATQREAAEPKSYLTALVSRPPPLIQPALFLIAREGHTNINQPERAEAFEAVNAWIDGGRDALPRPKDQAPYFDATVAPDPGPSTAVIHDDHHGLDTRVAEVDPVYGTLLLEAQAQDFAGAGIPPMTYFKLGVGRGGTYRALYGRTYSDVRNGEWVAFPDADGRTVLSRNFADAAKTLAVGVGDQLTLVPLTPGEPLR